MKISRSGLTPARTFRQVTPVEPIHGVTSKTIAPQDGFAAFVASNATTTIAPWGGREARLGSNPLGLGVPNPGADPILLDAAKLLGDGLLGARVEDFRRDPPRHAAPPIPTCRYRCPASVSSTAYRAGLRDGIELPDEDLAALGELS